MFTTIANVIDNFIKAVRHKKVEIHYREDTDYRSD